MLISVVSGKKINEDFSNIETFESDVVPQIGSMILLKGNTIPFEVKGIIYDYSKIQENNPEDCGEEMICIFI